MVQNQVQIIFAVHICRNGANNIIAVEKRSVSFLVCNLEKNLTILDLLVSSIVLR